MILKFIEQRWHGLPAHDVKHNLCPCAVYDDAASGPDSIARSIQLVAGRTGQEFNHRKTRKGAYWEDRYHATVIEDGEHLLRCIVYIDLNMVRAGVGHPSCSMAARRLQ